MNRSKSKYSDSTDKLIHRLAALSPEPVFLGDKPVLRTAVEQVIIGPSVVRKFTCVDGCTACCLLGFTLDYTPAEFDRLHAAQRDLVPWRERNVRVNGSLRPIMSFDQATEPVCPYLTAQRPDGGLGCSLWPQSPLECAAAPQLSMQHSGTTTKLMKRPFGRAWNFPETPQCEFSDLDAEAVRQALADDVDLLYRYERWADYLGIRTVIPEVITTLSELSANLPRYPRSATLAWAADPEWWMEATDEQ